VSQHVDGAIPNAAQFCGQCGAVERTLAFSPDRSDEYLELVCKRDKPLFYKISSQLLFPCVPGHCPDSRVNRILMASLIALRARVLNGFDIRIS
jgi:hypothetical protein